MFDRIDHPARGRNGGGIGAPGIARLQSGEAVRSKGNQEIPTGDRLLLEIPGGGGFGLPFERDPEAVGRDVQMGLVSRESAARDYGVALQADGRVDEKGTRALRASR